MAEETQNEWFSPFDFLEKKAKDFWDLLSNSPDSIYKWWKELLNTDIWKELSQSWASVEKTSSEVIDSAWKKWSEFLTSTQKFMSDTWDKISNIFDFQDETKVASKNIPKDWKSINV